MLVPLRPEPRIMQLFTTTDSVRPIRARTSHPHSDSALSPQRGDSQDPLSQGFPTISPLCPNPQMQSQPHQLEGFPGERRGDQENSQ